MDVFPNFLIVSRPLFNDIYAPNEKNSKEVIGS